MGDVNFLQEKDCPMLIIKKIAGGISGAICSFNGGTLWSYYNPYILITVQKKLLPWIDGLLEAGEEFYEIT